MIRRGRKGRKSFSCNLVISLQHLVNMKNNGNKRKLFREMFTFIQVFGQNFKINDFSKIVIAVLTG